MASQISSLVDVSRQADESDEQLAASWDVVVRGLAVTQRRILAKIERDGVPAQWFAVLRLLLATDEHRMPMSALARELNMTGGGLTKLADRMAREGLIDRRSSSGDRRVVFAALTPKGIQQAETSQGLYRDALREHVLDVLSAQRLSALASTMRKLHEVHEDPEISASDTVEQVVTQRDPALPDRRGRGRRSK